MLFLQYITMEVNQLLIWLTILLAGIFLLALLSLPAKNSGKQLMILFVTNFVLHFLNIYLTEFSDYDVASMNLNPFFSANYGPLLLLYFRAYKSNDTQKFRQGIYYFIPSLILLLWCLVQQLSFLQISWITIFVVVMNIGFLLACIIQYRKNSIHYDPTDKKWLLSLIILFGALFVAVLIHLYFSITASADLHQRATTFIFILTVTLIGFLVYFSILSPEIFKSFKGKYFASGLDAKKSQELSKKITDLLYLDDRYLDSEITLQDISEELHTSPKKISQAINQNLGSNFYDYINTLRITKAKDMLSSAASEKTAIKHIMYDCGFNNKVTFNKAFKERTGVTPSEFRKKNLQKKR